MTVPAASGTSRGCGGVLGVQWIICGVRATCGVAVGFISGGDTTVTLFVPWPDGGEMIAVLGLSALFVDAAG
jgi:hypothetical protein